jgi:hypothetical protein
MVEWRGRTGLADEVTLGEAAELLKMSPRLLRDLVDVGQIPARTNSAVIRISRADIDVFQLLADPGAFERRRISPSDRRHREGAGAGAASGGEPFALRGVTFASVANRSAMVDTRRVEEGFNRRLFIPDVRGSHRYLRVTWHKETSTIVLSHWQDDVCLASTPVSLQDATKLIGLIVGALKDAAASSGAVPEAGLSAQPPGVLGRFRQRFRPQLAQVIALHDRLRSERQHVRPSR